IDNSLLEEIRIRTYGRNCREYSNDRGVALVIARYLREWFRYFDRISLKSSTDDIDWKIFFSDQMRSIAARSRREATDEVLALGHLIADQIEFDLISVYGERKILEVCENSY